MVLAVYVAGCCGGSLPREEPPPDPVPVVEPPEPAAPEPLPPVSPDGLPLPDPPAGGDVPGPRFGANPFMTSGGVPEQPAKNLRGDLEATPDWFVPRDERLGPVNRSHRSTVPQLSDRLVFFSELSPLTSDDFEGLVACRFDLFDTQRWDVRGLFNRNTNPDVTLKLKLGSAPRITIRGPENTTSFVATIPHVRLKRGNGVSFTGIDRDVARDDPMGSSKARYQGSFPFTARSSNFMVECRAAPTDWTERQARALLPEIDSGIRRLEKAKVPDMLSSSVDPAMAELPSVQGQIRKAAAYVGFGHAEVITRVKRLDGILERWLEAQREQLEKMAAAPAPGTAVQVSPQLAAKVQGYSCDPAAVAPHASQARWARCLIRLEASYRSIPARPGFTPSPRAKVLTATGRRHKVKAVGWERAGQVERARPRVRSEGDMTTLLATYTDLTIVQETDRPLLLWIEHAGNVALLRLE